MRDGLKLNLNLVYTINLLYLYLIRMKNIKSKSNAVVRNSIFSSSNPYVAKIKQNKFRTLKFAPFFVEL